ncbi:alpha-glucosidase [Asticcacaulis sp. AC402]|uniref:alpha-glucosidase n=1 Tax=Asticcacaulis sp. AC402 TaxID=1282361 RepID=UPI0003C3D9FE|nr:alpha-glucosidase [Asticcacaulis sp. AC402]ESQ75094.1 oligo-1,6-glucosidase [Asticcacaulis sp. AC402]
MNGYTRAWWKEAVFYQIYPRSFFDSNGDGIGDLNGIRQKLSYIRGLGVDCLWLGPHFDSPNADNGYDIRDYRKVMAEFGTMADFDALLAEVKAAGMRLILDLVVNHTSDEHAWFVESRTSADNPFRDYYIWQKEPPNTWTSIFRGPAWQHDEATGDYYLHLFHVKQPDLNWDNPKVRHEVYDVMRFWLDKGVDGFRMDVIPFVSKDRSWPELAGRPQDTYANGPNRDAYLQEMRREVLEPFQAVSVGEAFGVSLDETPRLIDERRGELDMVFQFDTVDIDRGPDGWRPWSLPELKAIFTRHDAAFDRHCWPTVFFSNHDNPRIVSRYGDDHPDWRVRSAQVMATLLLTMKGTPFIYQGDELGMTNVTFSDIAQFDDIWTKNAWREEVEGGRTTAEAFIANQNKVSRDHARTPMPWTADGGFTSGKPWFALNPNFTDINAEAAGADPNSVYHWYARLIALRHDNSVLVYGDYSDVLPDDERLFVYERTLDDEGWMIVLNFSREESMFSTPTDFDLVLSSYGGADTHLRGWEARVYRKL